MRCACRSSPWRAKPSTLSASTGNTQGIRFRIIPPKSAPNRASHQLGLTGAALRLKRAWAACALACSAALSAGETSDGRTANAGHVPLTWAWATKPSRPFLGSAPFVVPSGSRTSRMDSDWGALLRWADSGTRAVHTAPSQLCVMGAAVSMISGSCANSASVWPRTWAGRPDTRHTREPSVT